ncbi:hypothetical protein [Rhizobium sp. AG855]|uniref:hypothetical protein n=1 Tax=Rhizobium sp. AG855 TaxID=2183898 RepID=UPI000E7699EC|nr:hypothetical protein [Rhizobium sp. AG855]RKE86125.1 hypothetical protein DFO46_2930 [Rhizobium sp. AG855]
MSVTPSRLVPLIVPALAVLVFAVLLASGMQNGSSAFAAILTVELLLPLVGVAVVLGQLAQAQRVWALVAIVLGAAIGLLFREAFYILLAPVPGAAAHLFLAGPIACALTGLILILPPAMRAPVALPLLPVIAAALAIATRLGDPALFARHYLETAIALQVSILAAVAWPVAHFPHPVLQTASRILGSWMLAVALLYGGAYVAGRDGGLTPPPFPEIPFEENVGTHAGGPETLAEPV